MEPEAIHRVAGHMERLLAATGFGMFMAVMVIVALIVFSHAQIGRMWLGFWAFYVLFIGVCMSLWAQGLSISQFHIDPQVIKYIGITVAAVMALTAIKGIIDRANPGALAAITGILMGGGLIGVLSIWGVPMNMLMVALILFVVGLVVATIVLALVIDRHDERRHQVLLSQSPRDLRIPYDPPKRLAAPGNPRNLPVVRRDDADG